MASLAASLEGLNSMPAYIVRQGRRYRAAIELGLFEQVASNEMIAEKLRNAGFAEVSVAGEGRSREAVASWPLADASAEIPSQIVAIEEIEV